MADCVLVSPVSSMAQRQAQEMQTVQAAAIRGLGPQLGTPGTEYSSGREEVGDSAHRAASSPVATQPGTTRLVCAEYQEGCWACQKQ